VLIERLRIFSLQALGEMVDAVEHVYALLDQRCFVCMLASRRHGEWSWLLLLPILSFIMLGGVQLLFVLDDVRREQ